MASVVAPSSWNSKDDRHVYKPFGYTAACWTLFRTKYCVQVKRGPRPWVSEDGETEGVGVNRRSFLASSPSVPILPFFLQKASLIAQGSRCIVFAVPCGCQSGIHRFVDPRAPYCGAQGFCSKSAKFGPLRNHPKSTRTIPQAIKAIWKHVGGVPGSLERFPALKAMFHWSTCNANLQWYDVARKIVLV